MKAVKEKELMTNGDCMSLFKAIEEFSLATEGEKIPVKVAYAISKTLNKLYPKLKEIEERRYQVLVDVGGKVKESGEIEFPDESAEKNANELFSAFLQEASSFEPHYLTIDDIERVNIDLAKTKSLGLFFDLMIE
jgi:hypothetical protein